MPKEVIRHKCDYCKRMYASKYAAINHEKQCFFNPQVKSCVTCANQSEKVFGEDAPFGESVTDWCYKANCSIFRKGRSIKNCPYWTEPNFANPLDYIDDI